MNDDFQLGKQNIANEQEEFNSIISIPLENGIKPRKV